MPPKKLVRRARKSLRERRLNVLDKELKSNLDKVELRKYRSDKVQRTVARKTGIIAPVPKMPLEVSCGLMTEELYSVERILRQRAGLGAPTPLDIQIANAPVSVHRAIAVVRKQEEFASGGAAPATGSFNIGLVSLAQLAKAVKDIPLSDD